MTMGGLRRRRVALYAFTGSQDKKIGFRYLRLYFVHQMAEHMAAKRVREFLAKSRRPVLVSARYFLISVLLIAGLGILLIMLVVPFRSDFDASSVQNQSVSGSDADAPMKLVIRITSFSEATNSAQINAVVVANRDVTEKIENGDAAARIYLLDSEEYSGSHRIANITVDSDSLSEQLLTSETEPIVGSLVMYHEARPYPLDDYYSAINVVVRQNGLDRPIAIEVIKTIAGRTIRLAGDTGSFRLTLVRPRLQQIFVFASGVMFMSVILFIAFRLLVSELPDNPMAQAFTVAGMLLGAAGFRELLGLSKLASFSIADGYIVGIPLLALALAFFKTEIMVFRHRHDPKPEKGPVL